MKSGRPVRTEIRMAECDGLDFGCGKGAGEICLDLGHFGAGAERGMECERREIKDVSWFLA